MLGLLEEQSTRGHAVRPVPGQEVTQDICVEEEEQVMEIIIIIAMIMAVLMVVAYAWLVAASDADRDAYEMYEEWKERQKNETDTR